MGTRSLVKSKTTSQTEKEAREARNKNKYRAVKTPPLADEDELEEITKVDKKLRKVRKKK